MDFAAGALDLRQAVDRLAELRSEQIDVDARLGKQSAYGTALLVEHGDHDMYRFDELVVEAHGKRLGFGEGHLEFAGQFVHSHIVDDQGRGPPKPPIKLVAPSDGV